jgi:hypothetical protein
MVLAAVSLLWVVVWAVYFRDDPRRHVGVVAADLARLPPSVPHRIGLAGIPWLALVRRILPVTLVFFCHAWTLWLYLSWLPSFFADSYHLELRSTALFSSGVFLAGMIGNMVGGLVTDGIYRRTGDVVRARRNTVILGFGGSLLFLLPVLFVHGRTPVALSLAAALFFLEMTEAPIWAVPIDVAPTYVGFASGIMSTAAGLAATVSPIAFGLMAAAVEAFGGIDILVNNAAIRRETPFAELDPIAWREVTSVILDGAYLCAHAAQPWRGRSDAGSVVNIGGMSAHGGSAGRAHVMAAKSGLTGLTRARDGSGRPGCHGQHRGARPDRHRARCGRRRPAGASCPGQKPARPPRPSGGGRLSGALLGRARRPLHHRPIDPRQRRRLPGLGGKAGSHHRATRRDAFVRNDR